MLTATVGGWELFWILFYGFATYGNAGYMREQVCKYMCPYARFQGAMFDRNTLVISYDTKRGDPRGSRARNVDPKSKGLGDCIDCKLCVQACPTGIDIRQGLQMECIACAACIDACDGVMDKMNYPRGLVRYTTQNAMDNKPTPRHPAAHHHLRLGAVGVDRRLRRGGRESSSGRSRRASRPQCSVSLHRRRSASRTSIPIRFINKDTREHALRIGAEGIDGGHCRYRSRTATRRCR